MIKLKEIRESKGMSQKQLAIKIGVAQNSISRWESGERQPDNDTLVKIAEVFNVSIDYLLGRKKGDIPIIPEIATSLDINLASLAQNKYDKNLNIDSYSQSKESIRIPVLGKVAAGIPVEAIENYGDEWEEIPEEMAASANYFALKIQGESMEPKFSEGDVVIVKKQDDLESGDIGVVVINGSDATVKKVMKQENGIMLIALNHGVYPPKFYDIQSIEELPVRIIGKVVELRAKF
jgi:repressor LexA